MRLITTTNELEKLCTELKSASFCAIDTEFLRETTYWPDLCLIQIASEKTDALIDPLSENLSLEPFFSLIENQKILKVFHAGRQDIEIIHHLSGRIPAPIFDTQVAAMVCGYGPSISYDQMIYQLLNVHIDKSAQYTNWRYRPLSQTQKLYALADVTYLCQAYRLLSDKLRAEGRMHWIKEEMEILSSPQTYTTAPEDAWKRVKGKVYKPVELYILQKLAAWRELKAQSKNVPRKHILKDETLIELALQKPTTLAQITHLRSLSKNYAASEAAREVVSIIETAIAVPKEQLPKIKKQKPLSESIKAATELLRILLKLVCDHHRVAPKVIASSEDLSAIATGEDLTKIPAMQGWRYELFGKQAQAFLAGKKAFAFKKQRLVILDVEEDSAWQEA